ncbi:MAG: hypothetical protein H0X26_01340 [Alphaproteobacteria bacterium]|nr:hypothetical protein [Alphaproteobacteria bacterium]
MENTNSNTSNAGGFLTGLFKNPLNAEYVYADLLNRGFKKEDITLMMSEETHQRYLTNKDIETTDLGSKSLEGMGVGGAIGGTVGAVVAGIAALGTSLIIPGLGIVVAGALAAGLAGAGVGAVTGGLVGALVGLGLSDEQAKEYDAGIKAGGVVIGVTTRSPEEYKMLNNEWKRRQSEDYII